MTDEGDLIAGRYRLVSRVGSGAMGVVWQAHDELLRRTVAVKQLLLPFGMTESEADEATRRAMREGRIAARLHHPHAISVYDVVEHADKPCLIMEYLPAESLSTVLATRGPLPPQDVARIGSQIAAALAAAHEAGIVHRDIKPGNVLLTDGGNAKITDFGISRAVGDATVTATGILAGTPAYLAPEVAQGQDAGFPADVFSLGSTLYTAVEGAPPFGFDDNPIALIYRITTSETTPPSCPGPLSPVLERLLKRNPAQRPTMAEAQEELAAVADHQQSPGLTLAGLTLPESGSESIPAVSAPPTSALPDLALPDLALPDLAPSYSAPSGSVPSDSAPSGPAPRVPAGAATAAGAPAAPTSDHPPATVTPGTAIKGIIRKPPRPVALVVAAIVLIATGLLIGALLNGRPDSTDTAGAGAGSTGTPQSRQTATPTPSPTTPAPTPENTSAPAPNPVPVPSTSPAAAPTSTASAAPPNAGVPPDTPAQLQAALSDYYALMPDNLEEGWTRMTADYQRNHSGGFSGYQSFWSAIERVDISGISAPSPDQVSATLVYFYRDGRVIEERTGFGLVAEDGIWKIARSTVLSSQAR